MCELYPGYRSCCGIPLRLGLVFIAILAIVTGALINGAIKKAGINVGSIQDVKEVLNQQTTTTPKALAAILPTIHNNVALVQVVTTTTKRRRKTTTTSNTSPRISTVEIIGDDAPKEQVTEGSVTRFVDSDDPVEYVDPPTNKTTPPPTNSTRRPVQPQVAAKYTQAMGKVNRNGLNMLAIAFIALGIFLLVANFLNSPEMALFWVVMCIVLCILSLVLLVSVVGECTQVKQACLLRQMDWMSALIVLLFWFLYIFVWAYFAAVANGYARMMQPV